mmetsp:Transcript_43424/g.101403  ORF Transcript_43424/g.101403 Transcript_43424/m.101403 type:complete len:249 (+) Transcript_43424:833-1579(+)
MDEAFQVRGVKGHFPCAHLVEDASHTPDVRAPSVVLALANLRRKIIWRSNLRLCAGRCALQHLGNAKIAHLDVATFGQKEIARLEISVEDMKVVDVLQRKDGLREPPHDLILREDLRRLPCVLYSPREITSLTIIHHDTQPSVLVEALPVPHDVGMLQRGQHLALLQGIILLLFRSSADVDHLHYGLGVALLVRVMLAKDCGPEGALSDLLDESIVVLAQGRLYAPMCHSASLLVPLDVARGTATLAP